MVPAGLKPASSHLRRTDLPTEVTDRSRRCDYDFTSPSVVGIWPWRMSPEGMAVIGTSARYVPLGRRARLGRNRWPMLYRLHSFPALGDLPLQLHGDRRRAPRTVAHIDVASSASRALELERPPPLVLRDTHRRGHWRRVVRRVWIAGGRRRSATAATFSPATHADRQRGLEPCC